ncbi:2-dehydro-3-deoxygalactonokinase [Tranquillimonas alkanivorans]|uniref:2-keto-3-deoxygalactonate kinase n=1 Tax=Tranquillimonas alkanivorans TaxID=441119 RepID=A0A1I5N0B1_9RHOB|nr:2-dehydro-3-deoxygalactonokinase [Tranquillimonas alkanivorans]SFP15273.1 2-keto-3-deoxygalactonate kinase [Tranquillimonas alkanivorans]
MSVRPTWIAVDWGTTHLRAWAMDGAKVLAKASSESGMAALDRDGFEPALLDLLAPWDVGDHINVVACGMVGARQGWAEAPYAAVPCTPLGAGFTQAPVRDPRLSVHIVPGVKQDRPADVMRGEETQIAGFLSQRKDFDGVLCLPGTHTKWVHVSAEEIVSFQTAMTGEIFGLLTDRSVLRHSVAGEGWDDAAFADAVTDSMSRPEALAARLFGLRAEGLLNDLAAQTARARLSGLLIGAELAAARPYWLGREVALIGAPALTALYRAALSAQGVAAVRHDGGEMTRAGLIAAHAKLKETAQ